MGIAVALIVVALAAVNGAAAYVTANCRVGPCKPRADALFIALAACGTALSVLLAATIIGIVPASVPWAGVAVPIALGIAAAASGISFGFIAYNIFQLDTCLSGSALASTVVVIATYTAATAAAVCLLLAAMTIGLPPGVPPIPG
jgi:hypothetical protein